MVDLAAVIPVEAAAEAVVAVAVAGTKCASGVEHTRGYQAHG